MDETEGRAADDCQPAMTLVAGSVDGTGAQRRPPRPLRRTAMLFGGSLTLGTGVAMLLTADVGSDGFSTLVNGLAMGSGTEFVVANAAVSVVFLLVAAVRGLLPGIGTVVQIIVVGSTVSLLLPVLDVPGTVVGQLLLLTAAFPVLAVGIVSYLGSHLGAGPAESAALAWDPPLPFRWSYSAVQLVGAVVGWLLGATIGPGTVAVILLLGPVVDLTARLMRIDLHQGNAVSR